MDLRFEIGELPEWGRSVQADNFSVIPGGKGMNQAVAASRLGADVSLISAVAQDERGTSILRMLEKEHVDTEFVKLVPSKGQFRTSVTGVFVNDTPGSKGEPCYVGFKGLMMEQVDSAWVKRASSIVETADVVLMTFEVPLQSITEILKSKESNRAGLFVLNPDPPLPPGEHAGDILGMVDLLVPNVWSAFALLGLPQPPREPTVQVNNRNALSLHTGKAGAKRVPLVGLVTPDGGCSFAIDGKVANYPPFDVAPVDLTGVTDAFCASLAVRLSLGDEVSSAVRFASAAGAISKGRTGGSTSMPTFEEIKNFHDNRGRKTTRPAAG